MTADDMQVLLLLDAEPDSIVSRMKVSAARTNARAAAKGWLGWEAERAASGKPAPDGDLERDMRRVLDRMKDGRERTAGDISCSLKMHIGRAGFVCGQLKHRGHLRGEKVMGFDVFAYRITGDGLAWVRGVEP